MKSEFEIDDNALTTSTGILEKKIPLKTICQLLEDPDNLGR